MTDYSAVILSGSPPVPTNGVTVKAWTTTQVTGGVPAQGTAEPGVSPYATATTAAAAGADGTFLLTALATGTYYLSWTLSGTVYWREIQVRAVQPGIDHWTVNAAGGLSQNAADQLGGNAGYQTSGVVILNTATLKAGSGSPNGSVSGSPGDLYLNLAGGAGTTLWIKESGVGTASGWVGK